MGGGRGRGGGRGEGEGWGGGGGEGDIKEGREDRGTFLNPRIKDVCIFDLVRLGCLAGVEPRWNRGGTEWNRGRTEVEQKS